MYEWPWTARLMPWCVFLAVAACYGSNPTGSGTPLSATTQAMADGIGGMAHSHQVTGTGGSGECGWSVSEGVLPPGLALATDGTVAGTPSAPGVTEFEVRMTDSAGQSATAELSIHVTPRLVVGTTGLELAPAGALLDLPVSVGALGFTIRVTDGGAAPPNAGWSSRGTFRRGCISRRPG